MTGCTPERVTTDAHKAYPRAIRRVLGRKVKHRTSRYLNNRIEQYHRGVTYLRDCWRIRQEVEYRVATGVGGWRALGQRSTQEIEQGRAGMRAIGLVAIPLYKPVTLTRGRASRVINQESFSVLMSRVSIYRCGLIQPESLTLAE